MITLTPRAIEVIRDALSKQTKPAMRIAVQGGGCSGLSYVLKYDEAGVFDKTYEFDGVQIIVDQASMLYLDGVTLDWHDDLIGSGFSFDNPNQTRGCGCGKSFAV